MKVFENFVFSTKVDNRGVLTLISCMPIFLDKDLIGMYFFLSFVSVNIQEAPMSMFYGFICHAFIFSVLHIRITNFWIIQEMFTYKIIHLKL